MRSDLRRDKATDSSAPCEALAEVLPGVGDGSTKLDRGERRHVEQCLRCQAELAQYRKLLRAMQGLRDVTKAPTSGTAAEVLARVGSASERSAVRAALSGRRVAYLGGIAAAATAAGAGAAIVLVTRGRKGRLPLAS